MIAKKKKQKLTRFLSGCLFFYTFCQFLQVDYYFLRTENFTYTCQHARFCECRHNCRSNFTSQVHCNWALWRLSKKWERKFSVCTVTPWKIKVQTIQYRKSRMWGMKEDEYTKSLDKNQVCAIFKREIFGKNVLPKFIKLCVETPCWCPFQGHHYGRRKQTETSVFKFFY